MNLKDKTVVIDNKTYRYSKIVMLNNSTSNLYLKDNLLIENKLIQLYDKETFKEYTPQHIYFLSTDKICEGDWYILNDLYNKPEGIRCADFSKTNEFIIEPFSKYCHKIIASTDSSLNLPKPSDSFLQVYIDAYNKNEIIEECLVEYEEVGRMTLLGERKPNIFEPKVTKGEITIRKVKDSWSREEVEELCYSAMKERVYTPYIVFQNWISENL